METLLTLVMPMILLGSSLLGFNVTVPNSKQVVVDSVPQSVELGLKEMSPNGEEGGFAIPASGCSTADPAWHGIGGKDLNCPVGTGGPSITIVPPVIRSGDPTTITWKPQDGNNCSLSVTITKLNGSNGNAVANPNPSVSDSSIDKPTAQTKYGISCDNGAVSVIVRVLPVIQET